MKKVLLSMIAASVTLLGFSQEVITGGNMESADDWTVVELAEGVHAETFNYTADGPINGDGGCLQLTGEGAWVNTAVCQEITIERGASYNISVDVKAENPLREVWVEVIVLDTFPKTDSDVAAFDIRMALNTWDCALDSVADGTLPAINCPAKVADVLDVLSIEGEGDTTVVIAVKVGGGQPYSVLIDDISVMKGTTGISATAANNINFNVYPNPVTDEINFSSESEIQSVIIYSITGVELRNELVSNNGLNISELPQGLYLIEATDVDGKKGVQKILKN